MNNPRALLYRRVLEHLGVHTMGSEMDFVGGQGRVDVVLAK
jgi:hypothetical protein